MEYKKIVASLYQAYTYLYGKTPDLKGDRQDLTIEFQAMVYFLREYGVTFLRTSFVAEGYMDIDMPMSMELQDILVSLMFGNASEEINEVVEFNKHTNKMLNILASEFEHIHNTSELRMLVKLHFTKEEVLPSIADAELCNYVHASSEDFQMYASFIANILDELSNDDKTQSNIEEEKTQEFHKLKRS